MNLFSSVPSDTYNSKMGTQSPCAISQHHLAVLSENIHFLNLNAIDNIKYQSVHK